MIISVYHLLLSDLQVKITKEPELQHTIRICYHVNLLFSFGKETKTVNPIKDQLSLMSELCVA